MTKRNTMSGIGKSHKSAYLLTIRLFMILLLITLPLYSAYAAAITNVSIATTKTTAGVSFTTDLPTDSEFIYEFEGESQTIRVGFDQEVHTTEISGLTPGTTYDFTIWTEETQVAENETAVVETTEGSFTTEASARAQSENEEGSASASRTDSDEVLPSSENDRTAPKIDIEKLPKETSESDLLIRGSVNEDVQIGAYVRYERTGDEHDAGITSYSKGDFTINLPLDEGDNTILLEVNDSGGNVVYFDHEIYVDTEAPVILEHNLDELSPAYTSVVTVTGRVSEPNIPIRIYVDEDKANFDTCSDGKDNDGDGRIDYLNDPGCATPDDISEQDSTVASACNDNIDNDGDGKVDFLRDPGCDSQTDNSEVDFDSEKTECNDGKDNDNDGEIDFLRDDGCENLADDSENSDQSANFVETRADDDGYFEKEISLLGGSFSLFETLGVDNINALDVQLTDDPGSRASDRFGNEAGFGADFTTVGRHDVRIVATDRVGQFDEVKGIVEQVSCSQGGGDWVIAIRDVYPVSIQPDHVFSGIAQVTFNVDVDYVGTGDEDSARINYATVRQQQRSISDQREMSPQDILTGSRCKFYPAGEFSRKAHVVCPLNKWPPNKDQNITAAYELLEGYESLTFPLQLEFTYQYRENDQENGTIRSETQKECVDLEVFVDRRIKPDKIPSALLNTSVELLDSVIVGIDSVMKPLKTVKLGTMAACFASTAVGIFQGASEVTACASDGIGETAQLQIEQAYRGSEDGNPDLSEICGEGGCDSCASQIQSRLQSELFRQQLCDRIFCPKIPTATEYIKQVNLNFETRDASACSTKEGALYLPSTRISHDTEFFNAQDGCGKEYNDKWNSACLFDGDIVAESKELLKPPEKGSERQPSFGDFVNKIGQCRGSDKNKENDFFRSGNSVYVKNHQENCYELAVDTSSGNFVSGSNEVQDETKTIQNAGVPPDLHDRGYSRCVETLPNGVLAYRLNDGSKDVVYDPNNVEDTEYISPTSSNLPKGTQIAVTKYTMSETSDLAGKTVAAATDGTMYVQGDDGTWDVMKSNQRGYPTSLNSGLGQQSQSYGISNNITGANGNFLQGPEQLRSQSIRPILKDPTASFISSLQCACLPAIEGYLTVIRNVLSAIKNCFQSVLITGEFQAGTCRALLTQYLCDWIYHAIKCVLQASDALAGPQQNDPDSGQGRPSGLLGSLSTLSQGSKKVTSSMQSRYGDTSTFNALFNQRKLLHAVCLAAFGYDWLPELDLATSIQGGGFSLNSTAFVAPATRRFVSSNPLQGGEATFIYHMGYFLSAGSDLNYRVELVCSQDNSCNQADGFLGGRCDCSYAGNEARIGSEITRLVDSGSVRGGETVGDNERSGDSTGDKYISIAEPVRYDKVRLSWIDTSTRSSDNPQSNQAKDGQVVTEIKMVGAREPTTCAFNILAFRFACDFLAYGENGDVFFVDPKVTLAKDQFLESDNFGLTIFAKQDYTGVPIADQVGKYARVTLRKKSSGAPVYETQTTSAAFGHFATDGIIPINTQFNFASGNLRNGAGTGFEYRRKGTFPGDPQFIGNSFLQNAENVQHTDQYMTRYYVKIIDEDNCEYAEVRLNSASAPVDEAPGGWIACEIGEQSVLVDNSRETRRGITLVRNGKPNVKFDVLKDVELKEGMIAYFDITTPAGSPQSQANIICADPTLATERMIAEVSLLHGRLRDEDRPNVPSNTVPDTVAMYGGVLQKHTVEFDVMCTTNQAAGTAQGDPSTTGTPICETGVYNNGDGKVVPCVCGARSDAPVLTSSTIPEGGLYCDSQSSYNIPVCNNGGKVSQKCACIVGINSFGSECQAGQVCDGATGACRESTSDQYAVVAPPEDVEFSPGVDAFLAYLDSNSIPHEKDSVQDGFIISSKANEVKAHLAGKGITEPQMSGTLLTVTYVQLQSYDP